MLETAIKLTLENFSMAMFILALLFILLHRIVTRNVSEGEMVFRWMSLFAVGFSGIFGFIMHAFFPVLAASSIGWITSPFQFEVAIANLAIAITAIFAFHASYGYRLALVIAVTIWFWGDAAGHIYQMIKFHNFQAGNAGSWFITDLIVPFVLIFALKKLKPRLPIVREIRL